MTAEANRKLILRRVELVNSETERDILIEDARSDSAAFARLYRLHYESVFRYCCRRLFNRHSAEEVTSTVFFKAMRKIGSFNGNSSDFSYWLYRIATNAVNDYLRTAKRRADAIRIAAQDHGRGHTIGKESDSEVEQRNLVLKQALLGLKPKHQTVITLRFFEKMKLIEIAEILGQKPATVRSQLCRALNILRKKLESDGSLEP